MSSGSSSEASLAPIVSIEAASLSPAQAYRLLTGIVVPRPIAWVTTVDEHGTVNLAPFSAFTMVSNDPPMVGINIGLRDGHRKDTARNIDLTGDYVVNTPTWENRRALHESGRTFAPEHDEAEALRLAVVPSQQVTPPRLASAPISMECVLSQRVSFGNGGAEFTVGRVVLFHVRDDLYADGKIDTAALDPLARVAGPIYSRVSTTEGFDGFATGPV